MGKPFHSVLIANRGEIAVRIIRACREANLRAIAVYSDADANALHVRRADEAHRLGPPPAGESYLRSDLIIATALSAGAEAIHPGYGFLSENADFAQAVLDAGLVWIGPPPGAMRLLGDKAAAKTLAERVGVPTLPGYHGDAQDDATLTSEADRIRFPLLVKATAGGGGRGMRIVRAPDELPEALAAARREAQAAFGSDRLLLERYLERPRHVEMQIFGDEQGNIIYLGERDCSIQRRHQKIIEESPAPNFTDEQRRSMGEASITLASAAGYTNAGTVEYLLDEDSRFYFLEVNARLQVEHPVTEMVTGLDLVQLQFDVAAGEPLRLRQNAVQLQGHAIEARIYAEDPARAFLPAAGHLDELYLWDYHQLDPHVRWEVGYEDGDAVPVDYDTLLAKLVVWSRERDQAVDLLLEKLSDARCQGPPTNLEFLRDVISTRAFGAAELRTDFLQINGLNEWPAQLPADMLFAAVAGKVLLPSLSEAAAQREASSRPSVAARAANDFSLSPWRGTTWWRLGWVGSEASFECTGRHYRVGFRPSINREGRWSFQLDGGQNVERDVRARDREVTLTGPEGDRVFTVSWNRLGIMHVSELRQSVTLRLVPLAAAQSGKATSAQIADGKVVAMLPGRIVTVAVATGAAVYQNQVLLTLEAMKIEHRVVAPRAGVVAAIHVKEGDQVDLGAILVALEDPS